MKYTAPATTPDARKTTVPIGPAKWIEKIAVAASVASETSRR